MKLSRSSAKPSSRSLKQKFDYQNLEARQMLSGNVPSMDAQVELTRNFILSQPETQYLIDGESDLRIVEVKHGLASTTTRYQQTIDGLPVHGAIVTINQDGLGNFQQVHHKLAFDQTDLSFPEPLDTIAINMDRAELAAMELAGVAETYVPTRGELGWFVDESGDVHQVWDMMVFSARQPVGDFLTIVDVTSGDVLMQENRAGFAEGEGHVFDPNPWQTQGNGTGLADNDDATSPELDAARVQVVLQGLNEGTGLLIGEFVDLATLNSADLTDVDANETSRVYDYDRDDDRFEQVVVYHSVDQINRYFHELGFDDDAGTPNGIRDFPTLANAHWFDQDQSFYSSGDDAIHMGDGGVDDGEDADIVAHEYGHAIQSNQNAAWGGGEMGAMGEGFGDFLAANFYRGFGDPTFQQSHAPAVGEWDALSYSSDDPPNLRRVDGNKMYPIDLGNGVHADGEIWSRALWDLSNIVGRDYAMQLVLESHFTLNANATMTDAANAILLAHENFQAINNPLSLNQLDLQVRHPFALRGILPAMDQVEFNFENYATNQTGITLYASDLDAGTTQMATVRSSDGDVEQVLMMNLGGGYMVGTVGLATAAIVANDGQIELINETTNLTVSYFNATDTATAEAEILVIEGSNGDDIITVDIGTTVLITVNGEEFSVDPKAVGTLEFNAKAGNDTITINDGSGNDQATLGEYFVKVDGFFNFTALSVENVTLNSGGGFDTAKMYGTDRDDVVKVTGDSVNYAGQQFENIVNDYDRVLTFATQGGLDRVTFMDTAGSDRFYGTPTYANMTTSNSFVNARGFDKVMAHATEGGFDYASFVGTSDADTLFASAGLANMKGSGYELNASGFERASADGRGGADTANLMGTETNDVFYSTPHFAYLYGTGYFNHVLRFESVTAHGNGGNDRANMFDSPGTDTYRGTPTFSAIFNDQYRNQANKFSRVSVFGSAGQNNAVLVDSEGNDRFVGREKDAYMIGTGYLNYVAGFDSVNAMASGGNDIAILHDSIEDNRFFGSSLFASLSGNTFYNRAEGFDRVTAYFSKGVDRARFDDSTASDTFVGNNQNASMFAPSYFIHTTGLDVITAVSKQGGSDVLGKAVIQFDLIEVGNWNE